MYIAFSPMFFDDKFLNWTSKR